MIAKHTLKPDPARVRLLSTAVFPIIKVAGDGTLLTYIGTGFFIANYGLFVTAKHVVMDVVDESGIPTLSLSVFHITVDGAFQFRPISQFQTNSISDLAIGSLAPMQHRDTGAFLENRSLRLSPELAEPGDFVATFAYPKTTITKDVDLTQVDTSSYEVCGSIEEYLPNGRDRCMLPGPCYRTSMQIASGASGGPASNRNGQVVGVNSTGFDGTDISYITPITDIFRFTLTNVNVSWKPNGTPVTVRELADNGILSFE